MCRTWAPISCLLLVGGGVVAGQPAQSILDGKRAPDYAFLDWAEAFTLEDLGLHLQSAKGAGGAGFNVKLDLSAQRDWTPALNLTLLEGNQTTRLRVILGDNDGITHEYSFDLGKAQPGRFVTLTAQGVASLAEPNEVKAAGEVAGFDAANVTMVQVQGDWRSKPVDVLLANLMLTLQDKALLAARQKAAEQRQRAAEKARLAAEQQAARRRALLAGAPHPTDGPDVRHAALVAPDILALTIQERELAPAPQVPYEAKDGDEIVRDGKGDHEVMVVENGHVLESYMDMAVLRREGKRQIKLGNLAVNAGMLKPEDKALGTELAVETLDDPAAYRISSPDDPAWREPVPPAQVWWKRKPNAYRSLAFDVEVFLKLPNPLSTGKTYRIAFPGVNFRQASVDYRHEPTRTRSPAVHVSAIGFRPDDPFKCAWFSMWLGTGGALSHPEALRFQLLDEVTDKVMFSGESKLVVRATDQESFKQGRNYGKTDVLALDFGAFDRPGRFRVYIQGLGCSHPFLIGKDVWTDVFCLSMKGLLHHRSGIKLGPPFTEFLRPRPMHPADGVKVFASTGSELESGSQDKIFKMLGERRTDELLPEAWGGHMDAGDWDRNSRHPAAMWWLVDLYELFPDRIGSLKLALPSAVAANTIPDILDEVLWNLELNRRTQTTDGGVRGGVESTAHPRPGEGSWQESVLVSAFAPDARASFTYTATGAKLSRALRGHAPALAETYATSVRIAWDLAVAHSSGFSERLDGNARRQQADEFRHVRNLAAFELWRLTGEAAFHDDFKSTTRLTGSSGDVNKQLKAAVSYARLADGQGDVSLRETARKGVLKPADAALAFAEGNAFGITVCIPQLPPMGYVGYLSTPETSIGPVLPHAWLLTRDPKYLAGAVRACQFAAGANPDNRAFTTGLGPDPVRFPLHIDSWVTGQPAPAGITVYGVSDPAENYGHDSWAYTWFLQKMVAPARTWPAHESYWDIYTVPSSNEYTIHQTIIPTAYYWGFLAARD